MEMEKLSKSDFANDRGGAKITFYSDGKIVFSRKAIEHLKLLDKSGSFCPVLLCRDSKNPTEFGVFKDPTGYNLYHMQTNCAIFHCAGLARHVIDITWEKYGVKAVGCEKPSFMVFTIAPLPLDEGKNKDVYALLRKKT